MTVTGQPISFVIHQMRSGTYGAREDFEQMVGLLVRATSGGEVHLISANPGDWGIDVLIGNLNGRVTIWQAKYFIEGVSQNRRLQIRESYQSAHKAAIRNGYIIDRWVLCIPCSMDAPVLQWWQVWSNRMQEESGIQLELWDENELRSLLLRPEAEHVRRHYYANNVDDRIALYSHLVDAWSAIDNLISIPRGQVKINWISNITGMPISEIEFSRHARNRLSHEGHHSASFADTSRALTVAHQILIKVPRRYIN